MSERIEVEVQVTDNNEQMMKAIKLMMQTMGYSQQEIDESLRRSEERMRNNMALIDTASKNH